MRNFFILIFFIISIGLFSEKATGLKKSINFDHHGEKGETLKKEDFAGYHELRRWAIFQSMKLSPDNKAGMLKDGICRMIPEEGLEFYLETDNELKTRIYLYLDLTTYINMDNPKYPVRTLNIYVGGKHKKTVYFRPGVVEENPARIPLDLSDIQEGRINVKLIPDTTTGGRFWGIWDVFYSHQKENR